MLGRMGREKVKIPVVPHVVKKEVLHFFPRLLFFFSLVLVAVAIVDYLGFYLLPREVLQGLLLVAGMWCFMLAFEKGSYERRKHILKRYI